MTPREYFDKVKEMYTFLLTKTFPRDFVEGWARENITEARMKAWMALEELLKELSFAVMVGEEKDNG